MKNLIVDLLHPDKVGKNFLKKYVEPYIWNGTLWTDNGWDSKNDVQDICKGDLLLGLKTPFYLAPVRDTVRYTALNENRAVEIERNVNERYSVAFPGKEFKFLVDAIHQVTASGCDEQNWVLDAYSPNTNHELTQQTYRLQIKVIGDVATFKVLEGEMVPSFAKSRIVSSWIV